MKMCSIVAEKDATEKMSPQDLKYSKVDKNKFMGSSLVV